MKKIMIVFFLTLFIPITKVDAIRCEYSELARLKKIASNINVSYDYSIIEEQAIFDITLVNLHEDVYLKNESTEKKYEYVSNEMVLKGYESGTTVEFDVYATDQDCTKEPLYRIRVNLPKYNEFYNDEVCNGVESYSLCQKWSSHNLIYPTFVKKVTEYKANLNQDKDEDIVDEEKTLMTIIIELILNNYLIILIFIGGATATFVYIKNKKDNIYS